MELFSNQIYELYTSNGVLIDGPCHDLDLLENGLYVARSSGNQPGFHVNQISFSEVEWGGIDLVYKGMEVTYLRGYGDLDSSSVMREFDNRSRDSLQIELGTCNNQ
jgi:hypothetical protein